MTWGEPAHTRLARLEAKRYSESMRTPTKRPLTQRVRDCFWITCIVIRYMVRRRED